VGDAQFFADFKRIVIQFAQKFGEKRAVFLLFAADLIKSDKLPGYQNYFHALYHERCDMKFQQRTLKRSALWIVLATALFVGNAVNRTK
jgi:hypothetical protein